MDLEEMVSLGRGAVGSVYEFDIGISYFDKILNRV